MAAARNYSKHQQNIIKRYYENLDTIVLDRLSTLVTDLFLADTEAKQKRLWENVEKNLQKAGIKPEDYQTIIDKQDLDALARLVTELSGKK